MLPFLGWTVKKELAKNLFFWFHLNYLGNWFNCSLDDLQFWWFQLNQKMFAALLLDDLMISQLFFVAVISTARSSQHGLAECSAENCLGTSKMWAFAVGSRRKPLFYPLKTWPLWNSKQRQWSIFSMSKANVGLTAMEWLDWLQMLDPMFPASTARPKKKH